jgi:hypothetical protein
MIMAAKKKAAPADETLVAKTAIAIEGKHFDAGAPIEGVSADEVKIAIRLGRVVSSTSEAGQSVLAARASIAAAELAAKEHAERQAKEHAERQAKEEAERQAGDAGNAASSTDGQPQA